MNESELQYLMEKIGNSREADCRVDNMRRYLSLKGMDIRKLKSSQIVAIYYKEVRK